MADRRGGARDLLGTLEQLLAIPATDMRTALDRASDLLVAALGCDKIDIFVLDPTRAALVALGTSNTPMGRKQHAIGMDVLPLANRGRAVVVFETGDPYRTGDAARDPEELVGVTEGLGVASTLYVPLVDMGGERCGVLSAVAERRSAFAAADLRFLEAVARWVAMVMHRAALAEDLARESARQGRRLAAEELVTILAHDLRRPLVPVMSYLELIARRAAREGREREHGYAAQALAAARRLNAMIGDLLDAARLDQGIFAALPQPVDLVPLVERAAAGLRGPDAVIDLRLPDELVAHADPERLVQALENLLANAIRHSPAGAQVTVTLASEERETGVWAVIAVRDAGPGIAPERAATLFDRFETGPGSDGLGLGLYLARGIAEAHGGTLDLAPTDGAGATFRLAVPVVGRP